MKINPKLNANKSVEFNVNLKQKLGEEEIETQKFENNTTIQNTHNKTFNFKSDKNSVILQNVSNGFKTANSARQLGKQSNFFLSNKKRIKRSVMYNEKSIQNNMPVKKDAFALPDNFIKPLNHFFTANSYKQFNTSNSFRNTFDNSIKLKQTK